MAQRFRYCVVTVVERDSGAVLQERLNGLAAEGYEPVHFESNPNGTWLIILRQEIRTGSGQGETE